MSKQQNQSYTINNTKIEGNIINQTFIINNYKKARDLSPDNSEFKNNCRELLLLNPNSIDSQQEKKLIEYLSYFKNVTKKSKYQLKLLDEGIIYNFIIPYLFCSKSIENNIEAVKILLNISKNRNYHFKLCPEHVFFKDLFNLLLKYLNTQLENLLLKVLLCLVENKDFQEKLYSFDELKKKDNKDFEYNNLNFIRNSNLIQNNIERSNLIKGKLDLDINLYVITRVLIEKVLDGLTSNNKLVLLKIILHLFNYDYSLMTTEMIEPLCRCLGTKDEDIVLYSLVTLYLFSYPGVRIEINSIQTGNIIIEKPKQVMNDNNSRKFHEELIKTNFIFRIVRVYKKSISNIDSILVLILLQLFKNNSLFDILFSNNINIIVENYLKSFENDDNDNLISTIFDIYKVIIIKNSSKISDLQKTLFEKALFLSQKNMKKEKFVLNCLEMVEEIIKINVSKKKENPVQNNNNTNNIMSNTSNLVNNNHKENEILDEKAIRNIFEQIPIFFKSSNKEILYYSLNIFEAILKEKIEFYEENYIKAPDRSMSSKAMINLLILLINENFFDSNIVVSCGEICKHLSEISNLHQYFLQEPNITILRIFCDDLIHLKEELLLKIEEEDKHTKPVPQDSFVKDIRNIGNIGNKLMNNSRKYSIISKKFYLSQRLKNIKGKDNHMPNYNEGRQLDVIETERKLLIALKIIENLSKQVDNLEIMMNKGFLEILNELLGKTNNNSEILILVASCIQCFCNSVNSINIILSYRIIEKILNIFNFIHKHKQQNKESKLELLLLNIKNILESNIKLQRQFIQYDGITRIIKEIKQDDDRTNYFILKILYVLSCSINKLYIFEINDKPATNQSELIDEKGEKDEKDGNINLNKNEDSHLPNDDKPLKTVMNINQNQQSSLFDKLSSQLSQTEFMDKFISIGLNSKSSINTYKEFLKILINLYLNRYYLKYFTSDSNFTSIIKILDLIILKYDKSDHIDIIKLILIFFKFISEEEALIKQFIDSKIILQILIIIQENSFLTKMTQTENEKILYNISLVLLRLSEFPGYTEKFSEIGFLYSSLVFLYNNNAINGKVYIISIFKNILYEKNEFFQESMIIQFTDIVINSKCSMVIYEFVELLKILVQNRNICKQMENVFKFLIQEINLSIYKEGFKKSLLELILCLSYENSNIKNFSLNTLLRLIDNLKLKLNKKTTLLILMNFSSVPSNFNYLIYGNKDKSYSIKEKKEKERLTNDYQNYFDYGKEDQPYSIPIEKMKKIVDHLIDSDAFSQILIQRFLINITSIENINLSFISDKVFNTLIEVIVINTKIQDNLLVCALSIMVNISNKTNDEMNIKHNKEQKKKENSEFETVSSKDESILKKKKKEEVLSIEDYSIENENEENDDNEIKLKTTKNINLSKRHSSSKLIQSRRSSKGVVYEKINDSQKKIKMKYRKMNSKRKYPQQGSDKKKTWNLKKNSNELELNLNSKLKLKENNHNDINDNLLETNDININKSKLKQKDNIQKSILSNYTENGIIEYIYSRLSNIVSIFDNLFKRNNLDIASLAIMLSCNLSKYMSINSFDEDEEISRLIESHFLSNFSKNVFEMESGKFFLIAIIKYCIFVSYNEKKVILHKSFYEYILNMLMNNENKLIEIELNQEDFLGTTVNYILIESHLKFLNITIELNHKLKLFVENTFDKIFEFYNNFLIKFTNIIKDIKLNLEDNSTLQDLIISIFHILITFMRQDDFDYKSISQYISIIIVKLFTTDPLYFTEELKAIFTYFLYILTNNSYDNSYFQYKDDLLSWIMKLFKLSNNSLQTDYYCLKLFTKNMKNQDEKVSNQIWKSTKFLKKLYKYITVVSVDEEEKRIKDLMINSSDENKQKASNEKRVQLEKEIIIKKESEKMLNIISFNHKSHDKLFKIGIYSYFKNSLLEKYKRSFNENEKEASYSQSIDKPEKQEIHNPYEVTKNNYICLVNIFLNKANINKISTDLEYILPIIFSTKELNLNNKEELFEIYLNTKIKSDNHFHEDYSIIFNVLFYNMKTNFHDFLYLLSKNMEKSILFAKSLIFNTNKIQDIFDAYMEYDKSFPSDNNELSLFFQILDVYIRNNIKNSSLQKIISEMIMRISNNKQKLRQISIVNRIITFIIKLYYIYFNIDYSLLNNKSNSSQSNNLNDKNKTKPSEKEMIDFGRKFNLVEITNSIISVAILNEDSIVNAYLYIQEILKDSDTSYIITCLSNSILYKKDFLMSFYSGDKEIFNKSNIDIREFVFLLNTTYHLNQVKPLPFIDDLLSEILKIYSKIIDISISKCQIPSNQPQLNLDEVLSSIFFLCDIVIGSKLSPITFKNICNFLLSFIICEKIPEEYNDILLKYYQEIIGNYKITSREEISILSEMITKYDKIPKIKINLSNLIGSIIINSSKSIIILCIDNYLNLLSILLKEYHKENILVFLDYFNQIYLSVHSEDRFELFKKLKKFLVTSLEPFDKEINKDGSFKKKLEKIAKKLNAY